MDGKLFDITTGTYGDLVIKFYFQPGPPERTELVGLLRKRFGLSTAYFHQRDNELRVSDPRPLSPLESWHLHEAVDRMFAYRRDQSSGGRKL